MRSSPISRRWRIASFNDVGRGIEEYGASIAHQAPRPMGDHAGADDADHRIEPVPAIEAGGEQARDRQHRGQRIGQHMPVGRAGRRSWWS